MTFCLASIVRDHARATPDAPALTYQDATSSFGELDERSSQVANALLATGVAAGDRVAVLSRNCPEFYEIVFGCNKIGAIVVGLNAPPVRLSKSRPVVDFELIDVVTNLVRGVRGHPPVGPIAARDRIVDIHPRFIPCCRRARS